MQESVENSNSPLAPRDGGSEMLLVASKVRDLIRSHNCNTAGDALDGLNAWLHWLVAQAARRAEANGRKTIRAHDFMAQ